MLGNLKSHIVNLGSATLMWVTFLGIVVILSLLGYGIISVVSALKGQFWSYFWIVLAVIFGPPFTLWIVWLRKHP
jgi:Na+/proline symporter